MENDFGRKLLIFGGAGLAVIVILIALLTG